MTAFDIFMHNLKVDTGAAAPVLCKICGAQFHKTNGGQVYCSPVCNRAANVLANQKVRREKAAHR